MKKNGKKMYSSNWKKKNLVTGDKARTKNDDEKYDQDESKYLEAEIKISDK